MHCASFLSSSGVQAPLLSIFLVVRSFLGAIESESKDRRTKNKNLVMEEGEREEEGGNVYKHGVIGGCSKVWPLARLGERV